MAMQISRQPRLGKLGSVVGLLGFASALCLSACSAGHHNLYAGNQDQAVQLRSAETLLVEAIDRKAAPPAFIGQVHTYSLAPGQHTLLVTYSDLFDVSADDFERIKSSPVKLVFRGQPGQQYQLTHPKQSNPEQAKAFAEKPLIRLLDAQGNAVKVDLEYSTPRSLLSTFSLSDNEERVFASEYESAPAVPTLSAEPKTAATSQQAMPASNLLQNLKAHWQRASSAEKQAFLQWLKNAE